MESPSPVHVPRWTPRSSPTISSPPREKARDNDGIRGSASEGDDDGLSTGGHEVFFPFSIGYAAARDAGDDEGAQPDPSTGAHENWNGMFLTWKDLQVTVTDRRNGTRPILQGLTGFAEPGRMLAIMGPSGCGKSTLLDALGGRLSSSTQQTGEILINGRKQPLSFGTSAYVTQDDTLITTLTVRETVHYSAQLQLPESMSKSEKMERAEATVREMGLQDARDTRIGGGGAPRASVVAKRGG
ncbi:hypothetical protein NL676_013863 [Syzygium grande]|nr:hypothetical protein NL676_013863 [Syzygium grande]